MLMPLIIQPSNSEKNLILTHMILLLYIHPYPTCRFIGTHIFGYTLDWTFLQKQKKTREKYAMRRESGKYLEGMEKFVERSDDLDYDNINCSTHNHNHIYERHDNWQLFRPIISLFAQKIFVVGVWWNGIVYESQTFIFVIFALFFYRVWQGKVFSLQLFCFIVYVFVCAQFHSIQSSSELLIISHIPTLGDRQHPEYFRY